MAIRPSPAVIDSFGAAGAPVPLEGGRGNAWRVGELVLRPVADGEPPLDWQANVLGSIARRRLSRLSAAKDRRGRLRERGLVRLAVRRGPARGAAVARDNRVGELFHLTLADVPEPAFVARRTDHWAVGDRVAWAEMPTEPFLHVEHVPELVAARRPLEARRQLVHGDLTGNVLFAAGRPPAIIDFSPFWRPPAYRRQSWSPTPSCGKGRTRRFSMPSHPSRASRSFWYVRSSCAPSSIGSSETDEPARATTIRSRGAMEIACRRAGSGG